MSYLSRAVQRTSGLARRSAAIPLAAASLLVACATQPTQPRVQATFSFDAAQLSSLRQTLEPKGWSYLGNAVGRMVNSQDTVERASFIEPGAIVRAGSLVRFRTLSSYATAVGSMRSNALMQQVDCSGRTIQALGMEMYSDAHGLNRSGAIVQPLAPSAIRAGSFADALLGVVCTGRFAQAGTRLATMPPLPARSGAGSGVAIAPQRVLTNAHVVSSCKSIEVSVKGQAHVATLLKRDAVMDLALLQVPTLPAAPYPALRRQAAIGEAVMVAGYPLSGLISSDMVVTDGIVNSLAGLGDNSSQLQVSAPVQPGNSGGPLLDRGGHVLGVVVAKLNALSTMALTGDIPQNVNFAIKPEVVALFLQTENLALRMADRAGALDTQGVAAAARNFTHKVLCKN